MYSTTNGGSTNGGFTNGGSTTNTDDGKSSIVRVRTKAHKRVEGRISNAIRSKYEDRCLKEHPYAIDLASLSPTTNPCRAFRLSKNLTVAQLADYLDVSPNAVVRTEQGFYLDPPDGYPQELVDQYHRWQSYQRFLHYRMFGRIDQLVFKAEQHPLDVLLDQWYYPDGTPVGHRLNPTEVSKLLCINQSVLNYWQNRVAQQQSPPRQFLDALKENGYGSTDLSLISAAYSQYRLFKLDKTGAGEKVQSIGSWRDEIKEALNDE